RPGDPKGVPGVKLADGARRNHWAEKRTTNFWRNARPEPRMVTYRFSPFMKPRDSQQVTLGSSVEGREIVANVRGRGGPGSTLLIGGMHGDEIATIRVLERFIPREASGGVAILSLANPDGHE